MWGIVKRYRDSSEVMEIRALWEHGEETDWKNALAFYYRELNDEELVLDREMETLDVIKIKNMSVNEFYTFLHDKYFLWKYTAKNRLATTRKSLRKYIDENRLNELAMIQREIFAMDHNEIGECLETVSQIQGLGISGASGLLAILFPDEFGTVDQFVCKRLKEINLPEYEELTALDPQKQMKARDGAMLIEIMREKALELNQRFHTDFWTPRKIDMILWSV